MSLTPRTTRLGSHEVPYVLCRVLPDTALVLRDVLREAARLWSIHLGEERYARLRESAEGDAFFTGRVRLEPVPPEREMVAVWLPFPPDFDVRVKPQLIDYIEPSESDEVSIPSAFATNPFGTPRGT